MLATAHLMSQAAIAPVPARVGTGVGSLSGWGAALVIVLILAVFAWWATRPARRRKP